MTAPWLKPNSTDPLGIDRVGALDRVQELSQCASRLPRSVASSRLLRLAQPVPLVAARHHRAQLQRRLHR